MLTNLNQFMSTLKRFGFKSRNSGDEVIMTTKASTQEQATEFFSKIKNLSLDAFNQIFLVVELA
jgi:hypothetical protein